MGSIESHIAGSEKLTGIHGAWPSFHDAEVLELNLSRGRVGSGCVDVFPVVTVKIHIFIEAPHTRHTLATLKFKDVEDFKMEGFNYQNAILGLSIKTENGDSSRTDAGPVPFLVGFQPTFGMSASFRCFGVEVLDAVPCSEQGEVRT